jgi:5-methylcytosine-specific restriction endonuclease McrA
MNDPSLADSKLFRSSRKWQRTQRMKLSLDLLCEDPFKTHRSRGTTETAKQVHHIIGLAECANDERAYSMDNLMSVCWKCHSRLEQIERKKL